MAEYTDLELNEKIRDIAGRYDGVDDTPESRPQVIRFIDRFEWEDIEFSHRWWRGAKLAMRDLLAVAHAENTKGWYECYHCLPEETDAIRAKLVEIADDPNIYRIRQYNDWLQATFEIYFKPGMEWYLRDHPRCVSYEDTPAGRVWKVDEHTRVVMRLDSREGVTEAQLRAADNYIRRKLGLKVFGE